MTMGKMKAFSYILHCNMLYLGELGSGNHVDPASIPVLPLSFYVALEKLLSISEPQVPQL